MVMKKMNMMVEKDVKLMNVLDAKMINTQYGIETYLDLLKNVEVKDIQYVTETASYYEITIGLEYFRLRNENYYNSEKRYFKMRMNSDLNAITIIETNRESLFAVKNEFERSATKELIGEWLIKSNAFRKVLTDLIDNKKMENVKTEENIIGTIRFLEKLLEITTEDILSARVERSH